MERVLLRQHSSRAGLPRSGPISTQSMAWAVHSPLLKGQNAFCCAGANGPATAAGPQPTGESAATGTRRQRHGHFERVRVGLAPRAAGHSSGSSENFKCAVDLAFGCRTAHCVGEPCHRPCRRNPRHQL
jgi:hypothetical protein